ncbi:DUF2232 domain-containing protein [Nitrosococcus oceani]|uniref:Membrane protein, putative n=2 Tax=Nitrosococcus oceani TaxID=1229 RepID=Q3JDW9_NITOC|nr:DUF2232 domain-containing protein [Nitrosococcus oceani]ABA56977.1 membrane protein, putative [Nitrosococcus oceani ATCC 19707]KFI20551.1 hypothetical protein IB75_02350 [Nitrosococcus oceani C-27]KFI23686.1 hypothetical protein HW44_02465 [Nitrosococcus oceani]GEM20900.1 hypothetical protein NONS58_23240 [Nitrosococcus oceani]
MREFARFIMRGRLYAIATAGLFGALAVALPPLSLFSGATVGLTTLRHGMKEGLSITAGATLVVAAIFLAITGRADLSLLLLLGLWLPNTLGCWILRITQSQASTLLMVGGFSALFVVSMHALTGDVTAWWQQWIEQAMTRANIEGVTVEEIAQEGALTLMNGLVAMIFGLNLMLTILLARWWQSLLYNPGGFAKEFYELRLPRILTYLTVLLSAPVLTGALGERGHILTDLFIVAVMMYLFQGLAAMHSMTAARNLSQWWLLPIYLGLFLLPPHFIIGLALVGVVDGLINLRGNPPPPPTKA